MSEMKPKFCKVCLDEKADRPMIKVPGSSYCREHLREYNRNYRAKQKILHDEFLATHNEFGEPVNEFGLTQEEMAEYIRRESERLERDYGPAPKD